MTFHKTRNILTPLYDMWFLVSCLLYVLAVTTSSRWKSPVQHQKAFWPSYFRGCRRYGGYEHAVRTGHQPANSWETKGVYDNDFTTSIKISLVRRYYFICTPFLPPVDLYPCTLDMLTFSGDLFFYLLTYINLSCSAILLYSVYQLLQKSRSSLLLLPYWRWVQPWLSVLTSSRTRSRTKLKVFKTNFKAWLRKKISLSFICYVTILTLFDCFICLGQHGSESRHGFATRVSRADSDGVVYAAQQFAGCTKTFANSWKVSLPVQSQGNHEGVSGGLHAPKLIATWTVHVEVAS